MSDTQGARQFLESQIADLPPFGFLAVGAAASPLHFVEASRDEDGSLAVRVPGRPPGVEALAEDVQAALRERGFASEQAEDPAKPWTRAVEGDSVAAGLLLEVLQEAFGEPEGFAINVAHGNRRLEHETRKRLAAVTERLDKVLLEFLGRPPDRDPDGDYLLPIRDVHITVAPRVAPGGGIIVRIFAIANVGVNVTPELGLFLANLNFGLMFRRFALDGANRSIWVDETLLGDHFSDDELRFAIHAVASIADEWDDRLKQMFGGNTHQEVITKRLDVAPPGGKPGQGMYL